MRKTKAKIKGRPPATSNLERIERAADAVIEAVKHELGEDAQVEQVAIALGKAMGRFAVCDPKDVPHEALIVAFEQAMSDAYDYGIGWPDYGNPDYAEPEPQVPAKGDSDNIVSLTNAGSKRRPPSKEHGDDDEPK